MEKGIFKAYDIRGTYPDQLDEDGAYRIGRALVAHTGAKRVAVGMDMRESSPSLKESFMRGLADQGADVIDIGLSTTPMTYFASWKRDVDAAAMVTASHNPAEYNGLKFCLKGAVPIGEGNGMEEIRDLAVAGDFPGVSQRGELATDDTLKEKYIDYVAGFFKRGNPSIWNRLLGMRASYIGVPEIWKKKIVIDFANGAGIIDKEVYLRFSEEIEAIFLFDEFDGTFPNHEANPLKVETLEALQRKVMEEKADLGIAYDGDADRVGFVDETGEVVPMDYMIALLAKEVLKKYPGGKILMDLRSSNAVKEVIEEAGGKVERSRVGHSLIKKQMRETGAVFAGELSGHYFFEENSKAEMATLAAMMLINLLNETGKKMSELTAELKRYCHSGEINSDVADKAAVMAKLKELYKDGQLDERDGVRIDFPDWWFNVRPSNTEPKLRLNLEAKTRELMEEKRDEVLKVIRG